MGADLDSADFKVLARRDVQQRFLRCAGARAAQIAARKSNSRARSGRNDRVGIVSQTSEHLFV